MNVLMSFCPNGVDNCAILCIKVWIYQAYGGNYILESTQKMLRVNNNYSFNS
jgi:hypothetical protein